MESTIPVLDAADFFTENRSDRTVAGVLLAAGMSSRFGSDNKLLAEIDGVPLVERSLQSLTEAGLDPLIAVIGHDQETVPDLLNCQVVTNPDYAAGQSTSLATGIANLPDACDAAVFMLGDMPAIQSQTIRTLVAAYTSGAGSAIAPMKDGKRGNPVLFDASHFEALSDVTGDVGGRNIFDSIDDAVLIKVADPGIHMDVDTPDDLHRVSEYIRTTM